MVEMDLAGMKDRQEEPFRAETLELPASPASPRRCLLGQEHVGLPHLIPPG